MKENEKPETQMASLLENRTVLEKTSSARDKQSVRTTFKLSQEAMDAKAWLAKHWGITQKEASDTICTALPELLEGLKLPEGSSIKGFAELIRMGDLVRKTQVISRGSRRILEDMAKEHEVSRDEMFDFSLWYFKALAEIREKKTRENRERALEILEDAFDHIWGIRDLLDSDDPILDRLSWINSPLEVLCIDIRSYLEGGHPIPMD